MNVVVASLNPVKIAAAHQGLKLVFGDKLKISGLSVPSGVADQPMSNSETLRGAQQRVEAARLRAPHADLWIGIEGGVHPVGSLMEAFAWVVVATPQRQGRARSAAFPLPQIASEKLKKGLELGSIMDELFQQSNTKHKGGAIGLLTQGVITRTTLYVQPVVMACIPLLHPHWYPSHW